MENEKLKENDRDIIKKEMDNYSVFEFEMKDGEEFTIKLKDINKENQNMFSLKESDEMSKA